MNIRKHVRLARAALSGLAIVSAVLALPSCGGGGGCSDNPTGPGCQPSTPPITQPAQVTRVVTQGNGPLGPRTVGPVPFTTTSSGTIGLEVNWTFASNDVDIFLARGDSPCTLESFNDRSCGFIATEESSSLKPEKLSIPGMAAGTYSLYVANYGDTDESVAWQVTLTSTSAGSISSAAAGPVVRGATKGAVKGLLEPR